MAIPTPSFWKIRKFLLIILFIIYCFLVGAIKNAFATPAYKFNVVKGTCYTSWTVGGIVGPKRYTVNACTGTSTFDADNQTPVGGSKETPVCTWHLNREMVGVPDSGTPFHSSPTTLEWNAATIVEVITTGCECPDGVYWDNITGECACQEGFFKEDGECKPCPSGYSKDGTCVPFCPYSDIQNGPPGFYGASSNCVEPPECGPGQKIVAPLNVCQRNCPSNEYYIHPETGECYLPDCEEGTERVKPGGSCVPKCNDGFERHPVSLECTPKCGPGYFRSPATGDCMTCPPGMVSDGKGGCEVDPYKCPDGYQHSDPNNPKSPCVLSPIPCPDGQEQQGTKCVDKPKPMPEPDPTTPLDPNAPPPATNGPNPDPASPDPTAPAQPDPSEPTAEKSDKRLGSIDENIAKLVQSLGTQTQVLRNIADNIFKTVRNLVGLGAKIDGTNRELGKIGDGINNIDKNTDALEGQLDGIGGILEGMSDGTYTDPPTETPLDVPPNDFGERTSDFLATMKSTGIFSLPNQISNSIPGGGSPILTIESGEIFGGSHELDFSKMSTGLLVLRSVFQIAGMTLAIRIITLKR